MSPSDAGTGSDPDQTRLDTSGSLSSSSDIDHGRFTPGTVLGGRYRIVGRLGRGGMGEVFRADDLKIGQPVALKFLPPDVDRDPARLTQLHTEVRMARQVSHPNVCRVYDIDEVEGHTFLSMEYVDGEDLASLLRRIGRLPEDRGIVVARQICAGLAAAHERGVVHRDFKPANVMLDGTGRVRITDFGLAGAAGESIRAGTPAYMAPEQLAGGQVTARSDIYALGLVLYELFTGRRALEGSTLAEIIRRREQGDILPPSEVTNVSPEIDRAVMRCLALDAPARPASALAVAAALPGGNPLAAAIAAGETPSPEMVAAAGEEGTLSRLAGTLLLAFCLLGLVSAALLAGRSHLVNRVTFARSADVLAERAREVLEAAGHSSPVLDTAYGASVNEEYLRWVERTGDGADKWSTLRTSGAPVLDFWYRTSPELLVPRSTEWMPQPWDPAPDVEGMASVTVDDRGRLLEFVRVPPQHDRSATVDGPVDWTPLFAKAGLDLQAFSSVTPQWTPRVYAEHRQAWEGPMPGREDIRLRVEAAAYGGAPVAFKVVGPWTAPSRVAERTPSRAQRIISSLGTLVVLALLAGAALLARWNLKSGRGDRRGANLIALALLAIWVTSWFIGARHWTDVETETGRFFTALAFALLNTGFTWAFYLALEPFVRRLCPDMLIGWTRVVVGQFRDARVGRDILVGVAAGILFALVVQADTIGSLVAGEPAGSPRLTTMAYFTGARHSVSHMIRLLPNALQSAMLGAFMYVVLLAVVRRRSLAAGLVLAFVCAVIIAEGGRDRLWLTLALAGLLGAVTVVVFLRYGLLALAAALYANQVLNVAPLTLDLTQPHALVSSLALLLVAGLAVYGFWASRAAEGLLRRLLPA